MLDRAGFNWFFRNRNKLSNVTTPADRPTTRGKKNKKKISKIFQKYSMPKMNSLFVSIRNCFLDKSTSPLSRRILLEMIEGTLAPIWFLLFFFSPSRKMVPLKSCLWILLLSQNHRRRWKCKYYQFRFQGGVTRKFWTFFNLNFSRWKNGPGRSSMRFLTGYFFNGETGNRTCSILSLSLTNAMPRLTRFIEH